MSDAAVWSYRGGDWFAVVGPHTALLLPPDQKSRVVDLWSRIDDGADFASVLDGLLASGLSGIPAFALVGGDAASTRVLVRGEGLRAVLESGGEQVEVDGTGAATWSERTVDDVDSCQVLLPAAADAEGDAALDEVDDEAERDHTLTAGLVRVSRLQRPAPAPAEVPAPVAVVADATPVDEAPVEEAPIAEALDDETAADEAPADDVPVDEATVDVADDAPAAVQPDLGPPTEALSLSDLPAGDDESAVTDDEGGDTVLEPMDDPSSEAADPLGDPLTDPLTASQEVEVQGDHADDLPSVDEPWVDEPAVDEPSADPVEAAPEPSAAPRFDDDGWMSPPSGPPAADAPAAPEPPASGSVPPAPPLPVGSWSSPEGLAPRPDFPPPAGTDHDGQTRAGAVDETEFARAQPGIPGQPPAPAVTRAIAKLLISNGEVVEVDRVVLIGRAPEARRFTSTEQPLLLTVPSPLHEISSTHVEVRPGSGADHGSAVVTDMGSTNGTVLAQPGLPPEDLKPGIAVQLIPGAIINLGDGVTIQVTRP